MNSALERFKALLDKTPGRLNTITESEAEARPAPGRWSKKEILGHLIDSASNNHQRFVRTQLEPSVSLPGYQQELWVGVQQYQRETWKTLVQVWGSYNRHLLHVITHMPDEKRKNLCSIGGAEPVTLEFLVKDYVRHLAHHLSQILE